MTRRGRRGAPPRARVIATFASALSVAVLAFGTQPLAGQGSADRSPVPGGPDMDAPAVGLADSSIVVTAAAVRIEARPPSFEVIDVAMPIHLRGTGPVLYTVRTGASARLLGPSSGELGASSPGDGVSVLITLQVPATIQAGVSEIARVRFQGSDGNRVEVPVEVVVPAARGIELDVLEAPAGVASGGEVMVDYVVRNTGNTDEQVLVEALTPAGWDVRSGSQTRHALAAGASAMGRVTLRVRREAATGRTSFDLLATVGGAPVASARARVDVIEPGGRASSRGPAITAGLVHASLPSGAQTVGTLQLEGPLAPGVRVSGEVSTDGLDHGRSVAGLSSLKFTPVRPHLDVVASTWQAQVGGAGLRLPDVAGAQIGGRGISGALSGGRWRAAALLATPTTGGHAGRTQQSGILGGATIGMDRGPIAVSASAARLHDWRLGGSELDALALGVALAQVGDTRLGADLAHRRFDGGQGTGYGLHFQHRGPSGDIRFRLNHAPGGRTAFARATDEVDLSFGYAVHEQVRVSGSHRSTRDQDAGRYDALASGASSARLLVRAADAVGVWFGGRHQRFDATTDAGRMATDDRGVDAGLDLRLGSVSAALSGMLTTRRRETSVVEAGPLSEAGRRLSVRGRLMARGRLGSYGLNGAYTRSEHGAGGVPRDLHVTLGGNTIPLVRLGGTRVTADFGAGRHFGPGPLGGRASLHAGIEATLGASSIRAAIARDPYVASVAAGSAWSFGVRIERTLSLPQIRTEETRGIVFRDLDGNGERDPGEPGAAGVVVRRGGQSSVTGHDGVFRLPGPPGPEISVDVRSLPSGWIAGPVSLRAGRPEVVLMSLSPVRVTLALESDGLRHVAESELGRVAVTARHESGRVWVARREGATAAVFDALPAGRYQLEMFMTGVGEPLQAVGELPAFQVLDGAGSRELLITLRPRPVTIRRLEGRSR